LEKSFNKIVHEIHLALINAVTAFMKFIRFASDSDKCNILIDNPICRLDPNFVDKMQNDMQKKIRKVISMIR
jgi:hypothetical protein